MLREIEGHRKMWRELWWGMADGDPLKYNEIRGLDAIKEFWIFYDMWAAKQEALLQQYKKNNQR